MSWTSWYSCLSEAFKKRAGRYIVNRYLGSFLENGAVLLEQLSSESGELTLENVSLDTRTLNGLLESSHLELLDGYIRELRVSIPWSSLLSENCHFSIRGLTLTLGARGLPPGDVSSTFHSMYESFSTMNLAQDMSKDEKEEIGDPVGGVQYLAETIDSILTRLRVSLLDTVIRLEYVPGLETRGLALELRIGEIIYSGSPSEEESSSIKKIHFRQIDILSDEFAFRAGSSEESSESEDAPLRLGRLAGNTELILRFSEETRNDFGIPSVLEELDVHVGLLSLHLFPHQIHAVSEILNSISGAHSNDVSSRSPPIRHAHNIESLLQKSILATNDRMSLVPPQWSSMNESHEFHPVSSGLEHHHPKVTEDEETPFPLVNIKVACFIAAFIERDENIAQLGGSLDRGLALTKMRALSEKFFATNHKVPSLHKNRLGTLHEYVSENCVDSSHIQVVGAPLQVSIQDPSSVSLSIGELSIREVLLNNKDNEDRNPELSNINQILGFTSHPQVTSKYHPDLKVSIGISAEEETQIEISLNPAELELDLGIVDRTYCLLNYADLDPSCVSGGMSKGSSQGTLNLSITSSQLKINFFVPKVDLRLPSEIPEFKEYFWGRHVHPESLILELKALRLTNSVKSNELKLGISSDFVRILYAEKSACYDLIEIQKSPEAAYAASIHLEVNLDETQRLFWKFDRPAQVLQECLMPGRDPVQGALDGSISKTIQEALAFASKKNNNTYVELSFDELSISLPSKHVYEIIYNRLGNDLLLWMPLIYRVKEHLFGVLFEDPLKKNEDTGFSLGFSNQIPRHEEEDIPCRNPSRTFPKTGRQLCIHVDTCVSIKVARGKVLICPSHWTTDAKRALLASVEGLSFVCAIGLERDPEILLFHLLVNDGSIKYGNSLSDSQSHFLSDEGLTDLFGRSDFTERAWLDAGSSSCGKSPLLELTSKILFDSHANLKSIHLSFSLQEASLSMNSNAGGEFGSFLEWVMDFFTVDEFPIEGYQPPVILTEMQLDLRRSSLDCFVHPDHRLTLSLGSVKVSCNFLDSSSDMSIALCLEDLGLFLSHDPSDSVENSVCFSDLDYLDLYVFLKENPQKLPPLIDVSCNCSLLRIRTCSDTIKILTLVFSKLMEEKKWVQSGSESPKGSEDAQQTSSCLDEDVAPDLAEAMEDLLKDPPVPSSKEVSKEKKKVVPGGQVFFFPNEAQSPAFPDSLGMSQSFYADPNALTASDIRSQDDHNLDEEFCILEDEIGTGIIHRSGEPSVRCLLDDDESILLIENHFSIPEESMDYLRTPKNFPKSQVSFTLKKLSVLWKIFGGNDFSPSREHPLNTKSQLQKMGMSLYVDSQSTSVLGGLGKKKERTPPSHGRSSARALADNLKTRGGPGRNEDQLIELLIHKLQLKHEVFTPGFPESSRQILIIPLLEICDRLLLSDINKLLYPYSSRIRPTRSNANMLTYKCVNLRKEGDNMTESNVNVALQPFRINIDQDTLFFIIDFGCSLIPSEAEEPKDCLLIHHEGEQETPEPKEETPEPREEIKHHPPFIKSFVFSHSVPIRIDYLGKYVDLTQGTLKGLLVGLANLNCSELTLKAISYQHGILGLERLFKLLLSDWLEDVKSNQVPALLGGVGPMYSFLQLLQGVKDLFLLPLEQYQKDGRILRGIQRGANSFTASTALSILELTNRMLGLVKFMAEIAFDVMSPEAATGHESNRLKKKGGSMCRPSDMREGVANALTLVRDGFDETARTLIEAASNEGLSGAVGGVIKTVPSTMMKPVIVAASATSNVLEGVKNQVAPEGRKEEDEKWRKGS